MLDEKQVTDDVERSFIRSAIYSLPRSVKLIGLALIVAGTWYFNR